MKLPEIAVNRPVSTLMLFAAVILIGVISFFKLNLDLLPEIDPPAISVITPYPGASASDVESEVTKYMEDQLSTTPNLDRLESVSKDNFSIVTCIFNWGSDLDVAVNDIREKIDFAKVDIADGADEPVVFKFSSSIAPVLVMTVTANESKSDLFRIVDKQIADPLKRLHGVGAIFYEGAVERQINVSFDRQALEAYHLSIYQIQQTLMAENLDLPAGTIKINESELQLRVAGRYKNSVEIANTIIAKQGDSLIRLKDVAKVLDAHEEKSQWTWGKDSPGMVVFIQKQSGENTVNVINAVKKELVRLKPNLPSDISMDIVVDTSDHIYIMIRNLAESAGAGAVLVVIICFIFLRRFRTSFVVSLAIPFSILAAIIALFFMGYTINVISLMSLSIAIGMVVDDAIVVIENIIRHIDEGEAPATAAISGASEVGMAVAASTLTIVAVFTPLLFIKGIAGIIFGQLAFLILVTILASLFISLTLTPMACSKLVRSREERKTNSFFLWSEKQFDKIEKGYTHLLEYVLDNKKGTLVILGAVLIVSMLLIPLIGTEFLPEVDNGEVEVVVELAQGTRGEVTAQTTKEILDIFNKVPELVTSYGLAGQSKSGMLSAIGISEGTNVGRAGVRLIPKRERDRSAKEIASEIRPMVEAMPKVVKSSVRAMSSVQMVFFGGGTAISIEVLGHDFEKTNDAANKISEILKTTPGAIDVRISRKKLRPEIKIKLDRDKAATLGLNVAMVASTLRANYYGFDDAKLRDAGDDFGIRLRLKEVQRRSIKEIGETPLTTMGGGIVKLRSVAEITETSGPVEIERKNRVRVTRVLAGVQGRSLGDVVKDVKAQMEELNLSSDVIIEWGGEVNEQKEAFRDLTLLLIVGIILVFMVMASEFEDFVDPLIIMFSVPFAFVGVILAFVFTGTPLNLMSFIGLIMLMGIAVKNAIVLIDYTNLLRSRGMELTEAIIVGGKTRLRPVLMTSLTTIFGMLPLAMSGGEGSEVWNAMGNTVIGGLAVSGLVTLVLIPIVYSMVHASRE